MDEHLRIPVCPSRVGSTAMDTGPNSDREMEMNWQALAQYRREDAQDVNSYLNERIAQLRSELAEAKRQIIAYQIAKDNLELQLRNAGYPHYKEMPEQVYGA